MKSWRMRWNVPLGRESPVGEAGGTEPSAGFHPCVVDNIFDKVEGTAPTTELCQSSEQACAVDAEHLRCPELFSQTHVEGKIDQARCVDTAVGTEI